MTPRHGLWLLLAGWVAASWLLAPGAAAQEAATETPPQLGTALRPGDTVSATPFGRYEAGWLHRAIMGEGHRAIWALPVRAPVLDLRTFAGGLEVDELGGGLQTRSLAFRAGDGQEWRFRSIDKDAARSLDPELRRTLAAKVAQDQIAHLFPLSATVVDRLLEAAGVLHATPRLVVLPDDERLDPYRADFAGLLGWVEVRPDEGAEGGPGFEGSERVVGSDRLLERLEERPDNRIDARAFLRARLMDALVGDWDRHPDQWRWAGYDEGELLVFQPVPRDRDWALSKLDGLLSHLTWILWPQYVGFAHDYPTATRQMWSGRALDRRLLQTLDREDFREVADDLQRSIDDQVVAEAVARLPESHRAVAGAELQAALLNRRDGLERFAMEYYELLAGWVDLYGTDGDERVTVRRLPGDRTDIEIHTDEPAEATLLARRTFLAGETGEVRLHLHGGDDRVEVVGEEHASILVRVIGGGGDDEVVSGAAPGPVRMHDNRGDNRILGPGGISLDDREWDEPVDPDQNVHGAGHRDWGHRTLLLPTVRYDPDLGVFVGADLTRVGYGFRQFPHRSRLDLTVAMASGTGRPDIGLEADLALGDSRQLRLGLEARLYGTEFHRFFGFGNETEAPDRGSKFYDAPRHVLALGSALRWIPASEVTVEAGARIQGHRPFDQAGTLVELLNPYGSGDFDEVVLHGTVTARSHESDEGFRAAGSLRFEAAPAALDVASPWRAVEGRANLLWTAEEDTPLRQVVGFRVGGRTTRGRVPYTAAAVVGGPETLRGYRQERFTGTSAVWLGFEARIFLTEFMFVFPGDLGLLALADAGRVFARDDDSSRWHGASGGGIWVSFLDAYTGAVSVARGEETLVYVSFGLPF